jgi:ATP-binding cassette subfamily F protein 3
MVSVNQLTVDFGGFFLFEDVTYNINPRDRIGLTGKNGAGKSTMLKIIAGQQKPSSGTVSIPKDYKIGYLPQNMVHDNSRTVFEEVELAFGELKTLMTDIEVLNNKLSERTDYDSDEYLDIIHRISEKNERYDLLGGANYQGKIETTLKGLGFEQSDLSRNCGEFSGGWRMRIQLAKILLGYPDLFLLDEPTNHLDIESIQWLEDFLKSYKGAVVIISHDKAFLDNITIRTIEISLGKIYDYKANYSRFIELRQERHEQQLNAYRNQQKKIEDTEKFIERFRYKATKAVQVQSRIKQLDKIDRIEVDEFDTSALNIRFPVAQRSGNVVVQGRHLSKSYGDRFILSDVDFIVERGEKVCFAGRNGEGKTTMARMIMGETDFSGDLTVGHGVRIGYFAQNQADLLNPDLTVLDTIDRVAVGDIRTKIRDILGAFMFGGDDVEKKVGVLSGGERTRLAMIKLLLEPVNLLIMDEPTNHLDMRSKEILKQAIRDFEGTAIIVSHDREFLDGLVTKVYEFRNRGMKEHLGGIYEFLQTRRLENMREIELKSPAIVGSASPREVSESKLSFGEFKELSRRLKKAEQAVETSEKNIARIEGEMEVLTHKMNQPENAADESLFRKYKSLQDELDSEFALWETNNIELEELKAQKND